MEYLCVDRGSDRCPCILMEAGQCYTCTMIQKGKCDCTSLWQGVCPYTEYLQRNKRVMPETKVKKIKIYRVKSYSPTLSVLTLEAPLAYGLKCREMGAFLMLKWKEWFVPISVLRVVENYESQTSYIDLGVNATGPKTIGLLKNAIIGEDIEVKGPFFSGLINRDIFDKRADSIVVAKGMAVMPLINMKGNLENPLVENKIWLDETKLPAKFIAEYFNGLDFEEVNLEDGIFDIAESLKEIYGYGFARGIRPNLLVMTSPYYFGKILKMTGFDKNKIIAPNHSNMCCGEGYCGSCSYTDIDGITVRQCKCIDMPL